MPVTNTRGARIKVVLAGSKTTVHTVAFDYAVGGGMPQHMNAMRQAFGTFGPDHGLHATVAYATDRGYVFAVDTTLPPVRDLAKLSAQRGALAGLHSRLDDMSAKEYNALIKAIWRIDREIWEMS